MGTEIKAKKKAPVWVMIIGVLVIVAAVVGVVFFMSEGSRSDDVSAKLERAERYMSDLKYEQAIALYNEVLEIEPKNVKAYKGLFDAYMATDNEKKAKRVLSKLEEVIEESKGNTKEKLSSAAEKMRKELGMEEEGGVSSEGKGSKAKTQEVIHYRSGGVNGSIRSIEVIDENRKTLKETFYDVDGNEKYYDLYEYDEQGRATKVTSYTPDGNVYDYKVNTYGDNGYCVMSQFYEANGSLKHVEVYEYYGDGTICKTTDCYADGSICMIKYYDTLGRLVKVSEDLTERDEPFPTYTYMEYTYDSLDNRTEFSVYWKEVTFTGDEFQVFYNMYWRYKGGKTLVNGSDFMYMESGYDYTYEFAEDGSCVATGAGDLHNDVLIDKYDADGKLIESKYYVDGTFSDWKKYKYSLKGEPISCLIYNENGDCLEESAYRKSYGILYGLDLYDNPYAIYY